MKARTEFEETHGYYACGVNGCILAESHCGLCVIPELSRVRSRVATKDIHRVEAGSGAEAEAEASACSKPSSPPVEEQQTIDTLANVALPAKQRLKRAALDEGADSPSSRRSKREVSKPERLGINDGWLKGSAREWTSSPTSSPAPGEIVRVRLKMALHPSPEAEQSAYVHAKTSADPTDGWMPLVRPLSASVSSTDQAADSHVARKQSSSEHRAQKYGKGARKAARDAMRKPERKAESKPAAKAERSKAAAPASPGPARVSLAPSGTSLRAPSPIEVAAVEEEAEFASADPYDGEEEEEEEEEEAVTPTAFDDAHDAASALLGMGCSPPQPTRHVFVHAPPPFADDETTAADHRTGTPPMPRAAAPSALQSPPGLRAAEALASAAAHASMTVPPLPTMAAWNVAARLGAADVRQQAVTMAPVFLHAPPPAGMTFRAMPMPTPFGAPITAHANAARPPAVQAVRAPVAQRPPVTATMVSQSSSCVASRAASRAASVAGDQYDDDLDEQTMETYEGAYQPTALMAAVRNGQSGSAMGHTVESSAGPSSRRSGSYKCGRCGQPKRGHTCPYAINKMGKLSSARPLVTAAPRTSVVVTAALAPHNTML